MDPNDKTNQNDNINFSSAVNSAATASPGYDPILSQAPAVKEYQKPNVDVTNIPEEIPEAVFTPDTNNSQFGQPATPGPESPTPAAETPGSPQPSTFNPGLNELSKTQKRIAAEMAADTAIGAYSMLWQKVLTPAAQFNEKKLQKEYAAGTINPNLGVEIDANTIIPVRQYTSDFNKGVEEALKVSDEFKEQIREPLVRVLEKRGLGLTDEQKIGWEVLQDFGVKTAMIISIRNDIKEVTGKFRDDSRKLQTVPTPGAQNSAPVPPASAEAADFVVNDKGEASKPGDPQPSVTEEKANNNGIGVVKSDMSIFPSHEVLAHMQKDAEKAKLSGPIASKNPKATTRNTHAKNNKVTKTTNSVKTPRVTKNPPKKS